MPAYAKVSLVTPVFHPSDVAFARAWSECTPGLGAWGVQFDTAEAAEQVAVLPPGVEEPVFIITRNGKAVVLQRRRISHGGEMLEVGRFEGLREVLLALNPIDDDALESIQQELEQAFPRRDRR